MPSQHAVKHRNAQCVEHSIEHSDEHSTERSTQHSIEHSVEHTIEHSVERATKRSTAYATAHSIGQSIEHWIEHSIELERAHLLVEALRSPVNHRQRRRANQATSYCYRNSGHNNQYITYMASKLYQPIRYKDKYVSKL